MIGKIITVNILNEDKSSEPHYYYIGKSKDPNILSNPFTFNGKKPSLAKLSFSNRKEALAAYDKYFDAMYGHDRVFTEVIDKIYEAYKNGETVYLGCTCKPEPCHGDIIAEKLQKRLILELKEEEDKRKQALNRPLSPL